MSPSEDNGIGRISVSVIFRPVPVDETTFAFGEGGMEGCSWVWD